MSFVLVPVFFCFPVKKTPIFSWRQEAEVPEEIEFNVVLWFSIDPTSSFEATFAFPFTPFQFCLLPMPSRLLQKPVPSVLVGILIPHIHTLSYLLFFVSGMFRIDHDLWMEKLVP